jgi:hypothetical protein
MNQSSEKLMALYLQKVPCVLLTFQYIEEFLRMYIAHCYQIINFKVSKHIPFKYNYKDLQKDSLGTLLSKFKNLSKESSLIKKIENLVKDRNYCAHEAYLLAYEQQKDSKYLIKEIEKIDEIARKVEDCRELISGQLKQVEAVWNSIREGKI